MSRTSARSSRDASDLYRAVWRWHFYAGLIAIPFLISLAVTGGLYLFKDEIDQWLNADIVRVEAQSSAAVSPQQQLDAAMAAHPGEAFRYVPPAASHLAAEVDITTADGKQAVYVDPYTGEVTGTIPYQGSVMWIVRTIHSLSYFGETASLIIEIVGGWSILLVLTGIYLWWPRGRRGGVMSVRATPSKRMFWRDLHAVTGIFVGGFILFLAITGMPKSTPGHEGAPGIGLNGAVAEFDELGLAPGYGVNLPSSPSGVYTGSIYPDNLSRQRVVHLDRYSGEPLLDMNYADYGPLGKSLEWASTCTWASNMGSPIS